MRQPRFTDDEAKLIHADYVELLKTKSKEHTKRILAKKYECSRTTIDRYGSGEIIKMYKYPTAAENKIRSANKIDPIVIAAIKKAKAERVFNSVKVGDLINLAYKKKPKNDKAYYSDIKLQQGSVFQKTAHLIYIRDKLRGFLTQAVSASEIETGHIRLEVAQ